MVNVYPRGTHTYPKLSSLREDVFYSPCCTRKSLSPTLRRENRKKSSDAYRTIEIETAEVTFPRATKKEQETSERRLKLSGVCPPLAFITRNPLLFFFFLLGRPSVTALEVDCAALCRFCTRGCAYKRATDGSGGCIFPYCIQYLYLGGGCNFTACRQFGLFVTPGCAKSQEMIEE